MRGHNSASAPKQVGPHSSISINWSLTSRDGMHAGLRAKLAQRETWL